MKDPKEVKETRKQFRSSYAKFHKDTDLKNATEDISKTVDVEDKSTKFNKEFKQLEQSRAAAHKLVWEFKLKEDKDEMFEGYGSIYVYTLDSDSKPITNAVIHLEDTDHRGTPLKGFEKPTKHQANEYVFEKVPPGKYTAVARWAMHGTPEHGIQEATGDVVIDASDEKNKYGAIWLHFTRQGYIKGRAVDKTGGRADARKALVFLIDPKTHEKIMGTDGHLCGARVGDKGEFVIMHVPLSTEAEKHEFLVVGTSPKYGEGRQTDAKPLMLTPEHPFLENIVVRYVPARTDGQGAVKGIAKDSTGKLLPKGSAMVYAHNPDADKAEGLGKGEVLVGENGEFAIEGLPFDTPIMINGHSKVYGFGEQTKPAEKGESQAFVLNAEHPTRTDIELRFMGSEKLEAHILQPTEGEELNGDDVPVQVAITGGTGNYKWEARLQRKENVHKEELIIEIGQELFRPLKKNQDTRITEIIEEPDYLSSMKVHAQGKVTDKEELFIVAIVKDGKDEIHLERKFFVTPLSSVDEEEENKKEEEEKKEEKKKLPHDQTLKLVQNFITDWSEKAEKRDWDNSAGSFDDMKGALFTQLPPILKAEGITEEELAPGDLKKELADAGIGNDELFALWIDSHIARLRNMREFVVRWASDDENKKVQENDGTAQAIEKLIRDYWNTTKWHPPGISDEYKEESNRRAIDETNLAIMYRSIVGGSLDESDLLVTMKHTLFRRGVPRSILNDIHTMADIDHALAAIFMDRQRRGFHRGQHG